MVTVIGGLQTTVNGMNAATFSTTDPAAMTQINVIFLNGNNSLDVGTVAGILNLPGATLNVLVGNGNNTLIMGSAGASGGLPAFNNALNGFNWGATDVNSTGTESVSVLDTVVGSVNVQENSGAKDSIQLWGVQSTGSINLAQNNGPGARISLDQLASANPSTTVASVFGAVSAIQGNGSSDTISVNRSTISASLSAGQGNGDSDLLLLGSGVVVSAAPPAPGTAGTGSVLLVQGAGNGDYIGVDNLIAGVTTLVQQDPSLNATGDTIGGVATPAVPPGSNGVDAPSALTMASVVTATNTINPILTVPTNGFANAVLVQLNVTQGSAPGDVTALVQLAANATASESLTVSGTLTLLQQDIAGNRGDYIFMGSYLAATAPLGSFGVPPYPYTPLSAGGGVLVTGSITATNEVVFQGDGAGDFLSVLFNTDTSSLPSLSVFTQGNGSDTAIFQENNADPVGSFNYRGGSGSNYVQADSNSVTGLFDGGTNAALNILGQDNTNPPSLVFVDFDNVIVA
jgi:hypothetical protein